MDSSLAELFFEQYDSPMGRIFVGVKGGSVVKIAFSEMDWNNFVNKQLEKGVSINQDIKQTAEVIGQLEEYFRGQRIEFTVAVRLEGTAFQQKVWDSLKQIPFGELRSYSDIAASIGNPAAVRAVGQANRNNPVPILVPCHRVVGKNGSMTGYAGSKVDLKETLIELETSTTGLKP